MATGNTWLGYWRRSGPFHRLNDQESHEETCDRLIDDYKKVFCIKGVAGLKEKIKRDLNRWADIKLNIAVVGNSGTGKSSFINLLRGLKNSDLGAAKTSTTEGTITCEAYQHPENKNFLVWDLPGVGTSRFPQKTYLHKVEFDRYDFFIIVSKGRFTENDSWLAQEVQTRDKHFFFIRTNIDIDIENDKKDTLDDHSEQSVIQSIRTTTEKELTLLKMKEPKVFLINNRESEEFDFGKLNNELLASCDGLQKDAMALSLAAVTKEVMEEKKRVLEGRIPAIAMDVTNSTPSEQIRIFQNEVKFYQKQFDIDDVTLATNQDILILSEESVENYKVEFDGHISGRMSVTTPTAQREQISFLESLKDFFTWSKENKLLYGYCKHALQNNLDKLYSKARELYDVKRTKHVVHAVAK